jgi:hypothetical protein
MLLKCENLKEKCYCSQPNDLAQQPNPARGLPPTPAWARSPVATAWAGEAAQHQPPPGFKLAHAAASKAPPSISRSTVQIYLTESCQYKSWNSLENPRTFPISSSHPPHRHNPPAAGKKQAAARS